MTVNILIQFVISLFATLSFAVLFAAPKKELFYCGLTGAIGFVVYLIIRQYDSGVMVPNLVATFVLTVMSRIFASARKNPATVYLISGIFPLVPGAGIYYTAYYFIMNNTVASSRYAMDTFKIAGAIAIGIVFGLALPQGWFNKLQKAAA